MASFYWQNNQDVCDKLVIPINVYIGLLRVKYLEYAFFKELSYYQLALY